MFLQIISLGHIIEGDGMILFRIIIYNKSLIKKGGSIMGIVEQAIVFAARAHVGQTRKGTDIPYITHPYSVGMLLQKANCSEEVIAAGLLHDTLEDTSATYEELLEEFGSKVAKLVQAASEHDKSLPWKKRKQQTIEKLENASFEEVQVITADKLHNLTSIRLDLEIEGEVVWERFNRGKQDQHWYYGSIIKQIAHHKEAFNLIQELENEVRAVFGLQFYLTDNGKS